MHLLGETFPLLRGRKEAKLSLKGGFEQKKVPGMTFAAMHLRSNINSKVLLRVLMQALPGTSTYEKQSNLRLKPAVQGGTSSASPSHVLSCSFYMFL